MTLGNDETLERLANAERARREEESARLAHAEVHKAMSAADDARWLVHSREHQAHDQIHAAEHIAEVEVARHEEKRLAELIVAHAEVHKVSKEAIDTALAAVDNLAIIHAKAHEREHLAHEIRHVDQSTAVAKAEGAVDKRLEAMNEVRSQLREQARGFATVDRLDTIQTSIDRRFADTTKHTDERYEENRRRIETLEKGDVKQEGRSLGQGTVIAVIIGAISLVGTILGIIIVLANFATGTP